MRPTHAHNPDGLLPEFLPKGRRHPTTAEQRYLAQHKRQRHEVWMWVGFPGTRGQWFRDATGSYASITYSVPVRWTAAQ